MLDEPLKDCPECNGAVTRLLFPPGIVFKGSGFHINDYPSSSKMDSDSSASSAVKTESKTESKPEIKSDTTTVSKN
jgi:predicted nucleic acid-binding Zn ribbon protein